MSHEFPSILLQVLQLLLKAGLEDLSLVLEQVHVQHLGQASVVHRRPEELRLVDLAVVAEVHQAEQVLDVVGDREIGLLPLPTRQEILDLVSFPLVFAVVCGGCVSLKGIKMLLNSCEGMAKWLRY